MADEGLEGWLRGLATVYLHPAIQTRKTAGTGARLILDWPLSGPSTFWFGPQSGV